MLTKVISTDGVIHEYVGQIDFRESMKRNRWRVVTYIRAIDNSEFSAGLESNNLIKSFDFDCRFLGTNSNTLAFIFWPLSSDKTSIIQDRRNLLRYFTKLGLKIIWKEDEYGYEINSSGKIFRKWPLNKKSLEISHDNWSSGSRFD